MGHPILVVEDDRKIARVVQVYLEGEGFRVITAERGQDALDLASKESLSLVILDLTGCKVFPNPGLHRQQGIRATAINASLPFQLWFSYAQPGNTRCRPDSGDRRNGRSGKKSSLLQSARSQIQVLPGAPADSSAGFRLKRLAAAPPPANASWRSCTDRTPVRRP